MQSHYSFMQGLRHIDKRFFGFLGVIFISFWLNLSGPELFDHDEGAFSEASTEMVLSKDFITPTLYGNPRFDKPILIYWLQGISYQFFGATEFAYRFPSALAASLWVFALFMFARRVTDSTTALVAATIASLTLTVQVIGRVATADALLNFWLALTFFNIYLYWQQQSVKHIYCTYICMGLGLLTKGPVAIVLPGLVSFLFFWQTQRLSTWWYAMTRPIAWLIMLIIAAPWYIMIYYAQGQDFIDGFILKHNVGRFSSEMEGHGGNILYYAIFIFIVLLPFTPLFITSLKHIHHVRTQVLERFLWLWFIVILVLFSLSSTKLPHYILYGCTPLFLLMAIYREQLTSLRWPLLAWIPLSALLISLPFLLDYAQQWVDSSYDKALLQRSSDVLDLSYIIPSCAFVLGTFTCWFIFRKYSAWQRLIVIGIMFSLFVHLTLTPKIAELQQRPVATLAQTALDTGLPTVVWRINMPSFCVYYGRPLEKREPQAGELFFTRIDRLYKIDNYEEVERIGGLILAEKR